MGVLRFVQNDIAVGVLRFVQNDIAVGVLRFVQNDIAVGFSTFYFLLSTSYMQNRMQKQPLDHCLATAQLLSNFPITKTFFKPVVVAPRLLGQVIDCGF